VVLDQRGVRWVVIGAGRVAERKLKVLLGAGADVQVVAPSATVSIRRLALLGRVRWKRALYRPSQLRGARFILAATSDPATNRAVARDARRIGIFVGVADDPSLCTLFMPAILRRGHLLVAVSTSGRSPGLARKLRDDLALRVGPEYAALVRAAGSIRARLRREVPDFRERARAYAAVLGRQVVKRGRRAPAPAPNVAHRKRTRRPRHGGTS
jgi:precorrin-2 dehydrogenase/sirohydrochlorin ferrochelatase